MYMCARCVPNVLNKCAYNIMWCLTDCRGISSARERR